MGAKQSKWIWYYGDYEIYHSLMLHTRRQEYDYMIPPVWKLDDCCHSVKFKKEVSLEKEEEITVYAHGIGHVLVDGNKLPFEERILLSKGKHTIVVIAASPGGLPSTYIEGETVVSDESWLVSFWGKSWVNVGARPDYVTKDSDPQIFPFCYQKVSPAAISDIKNGTLYDFGKEIFAKLCFDKLNADIGVFYGESVEEATDIKATYLRDYLKVGDSRRELPCRAFRYIFIPDAPSEAYGFTAYHEYLPVERKGSFKCSDERINQIWETAADTFHLNSREFYLDGIKRDRWVWSGDAYQSYLINRYIFFDEDIIRRTIIALRGKDPMETHLNTIMDYSFYWVMSICDYYEMTGDKEFLKRIFPKMESLMDFCLSRLDENGFASSVEGDWIFIDWAAMDKDGAVAAEQMLLLRSLEMMAMCSRLLNADGEVYQQKAEALRQKINQYFWSDEKGAFIDCFESGKKNVTRHANIFALLFGYADEAKKQSIIENVLLNPDIPAIRTPYFKFYELEALARYGRLEKITEEMAAYWGGMLSLGATSFWEEYDPKASADEQLGMYNDKFGKSLCHAWGASPIYLLGKFYLGVKPTSPGYETFEVAPRLGGLKWMEGTVPVKGGYVSVKLKDGRLLITAGKEGGTLIWGDQKYSLKKDIPFEMTI